MAIINNNVQNVQFLRNREPFASREAALAQIESAKSNAIDGSALLARYSTEESGATVIKTIVGYVAEYDSTKYLTIIDVEGGSEDVEELRQEILDILGEGVSSTNTVTDQLAALSGTTGASSAETSVEGAKAYAYDLIGTLDYTDTAVAGSYVSEVTQTDGKIISTTKVELPSFEDTASAKTFVTSVSEDKGQIAITKGTITSANKTITLTDNVDGGVDFAANVDGTTIIIDENTGTMSVASSALVQYEGDDDTVQISAVNEGVRTVSSPLTIQKVTTGLSANVKEEYHLVGHSGTTIGAPIQIYKDSALLSVALLHADYSNPSDPVLPTYDKTNGWTDIDATAQTQANQALCYAYEDAEGEVIVAAVPVGSFINEQEFASGITWDSTANKVRGVVDPTSESFLTVGENGFKLAGVQDAINTAFEALDADESGSTTHVSVRVEEEDGKITAVTVAEDNIANASDLAELSGKTITAITSSNGSIDADIDEAVGNKSYDLVTDASKIKMSGFTADASGFTAITEASTVTEAVKAIETEVIANEQTTAAALTDLDERVDAIEDNFVSGITVNGSDATVTNNIAALTIDSATSAMTATNGEAIVVDTDANGGITLGIAGIDCGYYDVQ